MKYLRIGSLLMTCLCLLVLLIMPKEAEALDLADHYLAEEEYIEAIEALEAQNVDPLIMGNTYYKAAQSLEKTQGSDPQEINKFYEEALMRYENGMVEYPERIDLKYNYEYVQALNQANQNEDASSDKEDQQDAESGDEGEQKDSQSDDKGDQQDSQSDDKGDQQDAESSNEGQQEDAQSSDSSDGNTAPEDQMMTDDNAEQETSKSTAPTATSNMPLDEANINQILKMLEEKEQDSLKNNQQVIRGQGDGGNHDW